MECSKRKQAEGSNTTNWDEAFRLYADVIASENDYLKIQATMKLAKMSKYAPEHILALIVPILVELLGSPPSAESTLVHEASAYSLKCIASQGEGKLAILIGQSGAIPIILRLLLNSSEGLQSVLLKCLRNIVTFGVSNRAIVAGNGGLEIVLAMLNSCLDDSKLILLEILSALALIREVRKHLWSSKSVHFLVEAASFGSLISRTRAAQAIGLLGMVKKARRMLVDVGAIPALVHLLKYGDPSTKLVAGNALGVISSQVDYIRPVSQSGIIPLYAELLQGSDPIGKEIAEDVFCVLAVHEENAITIVEHLVRILNLDDVGAKAAAADVIWNLSSYERSIPVLRDSGVIPILVGILNDDEDADGVKEKVAGAVAQLSYNEIHREVLASCGAIPLLINMLENELDELRDNVAEALVNFSLDPLFGDQISCVLENHSFRYMRNRVMRMRGFDEHVDRSSRQVNSMEELT